MIEVACAIISPPPTFLNPIQSFTARGRRKFGWKRPHRGKLFIILSFIEIKQPNLANLCRLTTRINCKFCKKNRARDPPLTGNYIGKIPFFPSFGAVNSWAVQGEIWQVRSSILPNFTLIGAACRPCGAKNPKTGMWVKTIPAELPAADPAGNPFRHNTPTWQ